jgi:hypothetical protein
MFYNIPKPKVIILENTRRHHEFSRRRGELVPGIFPVMN